MSVLEIIGGALLIIASVIIILVCQAQSKKQQDMSTALSGQSDNFFGKNKSNSREDALASLTKIAAIVLFLAAVFVNIVGAIKK